MMLLDRGCRSRSSYSRRRMGQSWITRLAPPATLGVLAVALLASCALSSGAREHFAREANCPSDQVTVIPNPDARLCDHDLFEVTGCGKRLNVCCNHPNSTTKYGEADLSKTECTTVRPAGVRTVPPGMIDQLDQDFAHFTALVRKNPEKFETVMAKVEAWAAQAETQAEAAGLPALAQITRAKVQQLRAAGPTSSASGATVSPLMPSPLPAPAGPTPSPSPTPPSPATRP